MTKNDLYLKVTTDVASCFPSFGGGKDGGGYNPLADALKDKNPMFAAGVDIRAVVAFIALKSNESKRDARVCRVLWSPMGRNPCLARVGEATEASLPSQEA